MEVEVTIKLSHKPEFPGISKCLFCAVILLLHILSDVRCQDKPPQFFSELPSVTEPGIQSNSRLLQCNAQSTPPSLYSWMKDGQFIQPVNNTFSTHRLTNINISSSGIYRCVASNPLGALISPRVHFQVAYMKPFTSSTPIRKSVEAGFATILELPTIDSFPKPVIHWKEGFQLISPDGARQYVTLKNDLVLLAVDSSDNGKNYVAEINNGYSGDTINSPTYDLQVTNLAGSTSRVPLSFVVRPQNTEAVEQAQSASIECVPNARPITSVGIQWYKKENQVRTLLTSDGVKYIITETGRRLTFRSVSATDAGEYECEASMINTGSVDSITASANLTVLSVPSFVSGVSHQKIERDFSGTVEIPCEARGNPTPTITWYFNAKELSALGSSRHVVTESGRLTINNVELTDAGVYQCFATNNVNTLSEVFSSTWLVVHSSPPILEVRPQNKTAIEDADLRLPCQSKGAPRPTITWQKDGVSGWENITSDGRFEIFDSGELLIARALPQDTGMYRCNATNSMGSVSASAYVKVLVKTQITEPPQDKRVVKGSSTVFHCRVSHDPSVQVTWRWYLIDGSTVTQLATTGDEHHISTVSSVDKGVYRCTVSSPGGNFTQEAKLDVIELPHHPIITNVRLSTGERPRSVVIVWTAPFDGNDPIQTYKIQYRIVTGTDVLQPNDGWLNLPDDIPATSRTHTVEGLRPAQNYQFRMSAVNGVGEGEASPAHPVPFITLPQEPPSGPPIGVTGSPNTRSSISLYWQEPDESVWNGLLHGYVIRYKLAGYDDSTMRYQNITNWQITSHELEGLLVFQLYEISVAAYNAKGVGVYSSSIEIRTKQGTPSVPPTAVTAQSLNSTAIRVSWQPPDPQKINGINQGYKIRARRVSQSQPEEVFMSVSPNTSHPYGEQTAVMVNLRKYSLYEVTVVCYTSAGDGPVSSPASVRTDEDLPGPVESLSFEDVRDSSLIVKWTNPVETNGILRGFTVYYEKKNQTGTRVSIPKGNTELQALIEGLSPVTVYTVSVEAKTQKGAGPPHSADIKSGVPPEMPTSPQDLGISDIQARSVNVQFQPGYDGKTSITRWIAEAMVVGEANWTMVYNVSAPDAKSITVRNLRPYTQYQVRLKAENIVGISGPSEPSRQFQTIQAAPDSPPGNVTIRAINATAVRISWTPLATTDWNGVPKGYKIFYKPFDRDTFEEKRIVLENINLDSFILGGLEEWTEYQVKMVAYNEVAGSVYSPISVERTREAVPSAGPANITALPVSSTSINVTWADVPLYDRNGMIQGYKIKYGSKQENIPSQLEQIAGNTTHSHVIAGLRKFVRYEVQVLAYTRMGDGLLSQPEVAVTTLEDLPDPPIIIYFPEVTYSLAQIVWEPPTEPNGVITGYRVSYRERNETESQAVVNDTLGALTREYTVRGLRRMTYYLFSVSAKTQLGWGQSASVLVLTMINRAPPDSPTKPIIGSSQVSAREVTISWTPQGDGYGPLRNYTIQYKPQGGSWRTVEDVVEPDVTSYTVPSLRPNTWYQFQVAATNDIGTSEFSPPSDEVRTLQDKPDGPPQNVVVKPITVKSIKVSWQEPDAETWNGEPEGYVILYRQAELPNFREKRLNASSLEVVLAGLVQFVNYEVRVLAYNEKGRGPASTPSTIYVGEAAPNAPPLNIKVIAVSSTELKVTWAPPHPDNQNGVLSGYKVSFWRIPEEPGEVIPQRIVVGQEVALKNLRKFSEYGVVVLAYNLAGDGPNSSVVTNRTQEDLPSRPRDLRFQNITLDSVNVTWRPPEFPNGLNIMYDVIYYQLHPSQGIMKRVQVSLSEPFHHATGLENVTYTFIIKARNAQGAGDPINDTVMVGPQPFSPKPPSELKLGEEEDGVQLTWTNGYSEREPISGFIIQAKEEIEGSKWVPVGRKQGEDPQALVSYNFLKLRTAYRFRVIAVNSYGISYPSEASEVFTTQGGVQDGNAASVTKEKAFYSQWWFLVIAALSGVIIILVVITLLCLVSKRGRKADKRKVISTVTIEPQEPEDGGFSTTMEMSHNRRSVHVRNGTLGRGSTLPRAPPRPSPASVTYSDDDYKPHLDDDNSSSLDEKPDLGDSTEPSDEESEPESQQGPSTINFNNPYVNGPVRQSWYRQNPSNAYSYTDSEQESSHYATGLNGGQLIVNNRAGSRAPLPGYSSFV